MPYPLLKTESTPSLQRRTLPELKTSYHCSLIGTCFSPAELNKLTRKLGLELWPNAAEHEVHAAFVAIAEEPKAGKVLSKALDAKFRQSIHRFRQAASDEELRRLWREAGESGRRLGAYWAVLTHPHASEKLRQEIHGEVHMLSHEAFRERRREERLTARLRKDGDELRQKLARAHEKRRLDGQRHRGEIATLTNRLQQAEKTARRYREADRQLEELKEGTGLRRLQIRIAELERELAARTAEMEERQRQLERLGKELDRFRRRQERDRRRQPVAALAPSPYQGPLSCLHCKDHQTANCPGLDLCGRKILYVGGMNSLIPRYRELVEKHGGSFVHHDGGKEEAKKGLPELLGQADAVFCPVNCVSHEACLCAKKFCKRAAKPFVLMRSSSLSSLSRGLEQLS